jgi:hypothetical protein
VPTVEHVAVIVEAKLTDGCPLRFT